jgi:hypothetical protein
MPPSRVKTSVKICGSSWSLARQIRAPPSEMSTTRQASGRAGFAGVDPGVVLERPPRLFAQLRMCAVIADHDHGRLSLPGAARAQSWRAVQRRKASRGSLRSGESASVVPRVLGTRSMTYVVLFGAHHGSRRRAKAVCPKAHSAACVRRMARRQNADTTKMWPYVSLLFQSYEGLVTADGTRSAGNANDEFELADMV